MARNRRGVIPPEVSLERERQAWALRTERGLTHAAIAEQLHVDRSSVSRMLARTARAVRAELQEDALRVQTEQIAQLEKIVQESLAAWEQSKTAARSASRRTARGQAVGGELNEETTTATERYGDSRLLETAMRAMRDIRLILGIEQNRPQVVVANFSGNRPPFMTDEDRRQRIVALLDEGRRAAAIDGEFHPSEPG